MNDDDELTKKEMCAWMENRFLHGGYTHGRLSNGLFFSFVIDVMVPGDGWNLGSELEKTDFFFFTLAFFFFLFFSTGNSGGYTHYR